MKIKIKLMLCLALSGLLFYLPVFAEEASNYELSERISQLEEKLKGGVLPEGWAERVKLSGVIEVEATFTDMDDEWADNNSSDLDLATADIGIDVEFHEWVKGHILLSWNCEDDNDVGIDEADITLGGTENYPFYIKMGRLYVPFGSFESNMVSDPLTLEIGEIRDGAVQVGAETSMGLYFAVYAFNGEVDEAEEDDEIGCFGASAGYAFENDNVSLDVGVDYINNILESGMGELLEGDLKEYVGGASAHVLINFGPFGIIGEYVCALDEIENTDGLKHDEPSAWNAELGYTFQVSEKEGTVAVAYQGTEECAGFLPEIRILGSVGLGLTDNLGVTLEYATIRIMAKKTAAPMKTKIP